MTNILIIIALFSAFLFALVGGFLTGLYLVCKIEADDYNDEALPDEYCFECEIEMPVKEKNGRLYCANCGLYH
ncbi:hypothetical protein CFS9_13440 [Flavobacterium sp. CFS9]|uniref:Uncharacterized protein n=1 Tax=Flavobacterium sp. CFS9 TaxID=3143118 RepID=A0AAT9GZ32_9FLAO